MAGVEEVERELTRFLRRARRASRGLAGQVHPELDAAGYAVLVVVEEESRIDPVRSGEVATVLGLHKSQVSRSLAGLEALGLIRQHPDPDDGRARLVDLTPAGRDALTRARTGRRAELTSKLDGWTQQDLVALARLLGRLNDDLD
ncbi:DNA-binding MarR family transcriptional regulator [Friedmanniella endophytica]|uniref:DNA-binding MarR family transcriptional regulator n=1 Tax=Microlunatus kandeliicorticis TaxID=1759536 RepID=A0A7W3ITV0_9ACTN|nr:MarR family transcriptional regulator [Microlunatus kandeliicorticis]MBA8795093.1 DNA-binding MarR family transcriptional regulator [Microlunatus kandeliicorticis]